jgi:hypothetical protein
VHVDDVSEAVVTVCSQLGEEGEEKGEEEAQGERGDSGNEKLGGGGGGGGGGGAAGGGGGGGKKRYGQVSKFLIGNSREKMTTRQYFELISKHTGRACPSRSMNLSLGFGLGWLNTVASSWVTGREPLLPVDLMRTAMWGGIEYDCGRSERELGLSYKPIDDAVRESVADVQERLGLPGRPIN